MNTAVAYKMKVEPIILKQLIVECDVPQASLAEATGLARPTINLVVNRGYIPVRKTGQFKAIIESIVSGNEGAMRWLISRGKTVSDIWKPVGKNLFHAQPAGNHARGAATSRQKAAVPGDPEKITIKWEVEMITGEALRHFKIFRNPFIDDIQKDTDIFMSEEHRYIEAAMIDAAEHGGFLAVIGEVGSGKSVMRRKVVEQLRRDGTILIIYPQMIDKSRLNAGSICDAIIMDISSEKPRVKLEAKTRQVQKLLLERSKQNYRSVLLIEEAQDLDIRTIKHLKRFYELEDGYRKLLGIILIGQTELKHIFNEAQNVDMREVIRRVQIAEIRGLNGNIRDYLSLKLKRVGVEIDKVFEPDAIKALSARLTSEDGRTKKKISHAYPLLVNNYAAKAMNMAADMGEAKVTAEVVHAI